MNPIAEQFLWSEKYRPRTVEDCVLPSTTKKVFLDFLKQGKLPNFLFTGGPGIGKTTVAKALCDELGCDYYVLNGSLNGNIDTLRNEITSFASTVSFTGGRKYVILDEADYLNPSSTQPALRNFMDEFSANCGFILTCNYKERILEPLRSRLSVVEFRIDPKEKQEMAIAFFKRVVSILKAENVQYEPDVVAELIKRHVGDWRKVLNELQRYAATGKIDSGIFFSHTAEAMSGLVAALKEKNYTAMRKWVAENADTDPRGIFRRLFDVAKEKMENESLPQLGITLARYDYQAAFVADQELNLTAALTEVMADSTWK